MTMKPTARTRAAALAVPLMLGASLLAASPASAGDVDSRVVGWASCGDGPESLLTVQPTEHLLSCGDGNSGLRRLTWSSWTATSARATGVYYWNDCEPACFSGTNYTSKATVELSRVRVQKGEPVFTRVVVTYTDEDGVKQVDAMTSLPWLG